VKVAVFTDATRRHFNQPDNVGPGERVCVRYRLLAFRGAVGTGPSTSDAKPV